MSEQKVFNIGPDRITIAFERFGNPEAPPVFLIMGAGAQLIHWPAGFCEALVQHGLQPIRFDNRDAGLSTHMNGAPVPDFSAVRSGDFSSVAYSLSDMAADTVGLMDALGFDSAHFVGASMGGMIAQTLAIEYPARVRSLTSIMSTTGNPAVGQPDYTLLAALGAPPSERTAYVQWKVKTSKALASPGYSFDETAAAALAELAWDRDHDLLAMHRQAIAVIKSGDRTEQLRSLQVPALVIHGADDKMIHVSGGRATAAAIPGAELLICEGMGHHLPEALWPQLADRIAQLVHRAELQAS